jgi:hypothetical protein
MEIGKQHRYFETGCLKIDKLIDRDEVAEVDLTTRFVTGIDSFRGL